MEYFFVPTGSLNRVVEVSSYCVLVLANGRRSTLGVITLDCPSSKTSSGRIAPIGKASSADSRRCSTLIANCRSEIIVGAILKTKDV